jgi:CheY-like chemotaxis protein
MESPLKKILIVEDQKEKSQAIKECLADALPHHKLEVTDTILVAGQLIDSSGPWSGILLDLSFRRTQQIGSNQNRPFLAGLEILQQLNEMRVDWPVIVATQHSSFFSTRYGDFQSIDDLRSVLTEAFPLNYKGLIEVDLGGTAWRRLLIDATKRFFQ